MIKENKNSILYTLSNLAVNIFLIIFVPFLVKYCKKFLMLKIQTFEIVDRDSDDNEGHNQDFDENFDENFDEDSNNNFNQTHNHDFSDYNDDRVYQYNDVHLCDGQVSVKYKDLIIRIIFNFLLIILYNFLNSKVFSFWAILYWILKNCFYLSLDLALKFQSVNCTENEKMVNFYLWILLIFGGYGWFFYLI